MARAPATYFGRRADGGGSPLRIDATRQEGVAILTVSGPLSILGCPLFARALEKVRVLGSKVLVLDLGGVEYMNAAALGLIVRAHARHRDRRAVVCLVRPRRGAARVLEEAKLDRLMPVFDSTAYAIAATGGVRPVGRGGPGSESLAQDNERQFGRSNRARLRSRARRRSQTSSRVRALVRSGHNMSESQAINTNRQIHGWRRARRNFGPRRRNRE